MRGAKRGHELTRLINELTQDEGEELVLRDPRSDEEHSVYNPQLTDEEIAALTGEVGKVLNLRVNPQTSDAENADDTENAGDTEQDQ